MKRFIRKTIGKTVDGNPVLLCIPIRSSMSAKPVDAFATDGERRVSIDAPTTAYVRKLVPTGYANATNIQWSEFCKWAFA